MNGDLLIGPGVVLVPYVEVNGSRLIPDSVIAEFWHQAAKEGAERILFGSDVFPGEMFLRMLKTPSTLPVFLFRTGEVKPVGVGWLNYLAESHAFSHFFFLKEAWGKDCLSMGAALTRYWLNLGEPPLKVLVGNIPSVNKHAIRFVQKLGWKVVGEIPHMAKGKSMTITYAEAGNGGE